MSLAGGGLALTDVAAVDSLATLAPPPPPLAAVLVRLASTLAFFDVNDKSAEALPPAASPTPPPALADPTPTEAPRWPSPAPRSAPRPPTPFSALFATTNEENDRSSSALLLATTTGSRVRLAPPERLALPPLLLPPLGVPSVPPALDPDSDMLLALAVRASDTSLRRLREGLPRMEFERDSEWGGTPASPSLPMPPYLCCCCCCCSSHDMGIGWRVENGRDLDAKAGSGLHQD